ncbi:polyphosphate kinase [Novispirillum sp. DQ9]|uniref:polyphosphate kinase n=1 Tax=Novispirillum sp. DQ9 TaxID=3398612 RepID=UPI003C7AAB48
MFRTAELGRKVSKDDFAEIAPALRIEMLELQHRLRAFPFPVIVVFAGVDGAGKGESVNLLNEWMDPRWIESHAYGEPSDEERERPEFWRYWRDLPGKGRIGLFLSSWYSAPVLDHAHGRIGDAELDERLRQVAAFEKMLADDGALILKFWMHLGKDAQRQRLKKLEKDPLESWRVTERDWQNWQMYDQFIAAAERTIRVTSAGHAPWALVEGSDARYRSLTVLTSLRDAMTRHMEAWELKRRVAEDLRKAEQAKEKEAAEPKAKTKGKGKAASEGARQGTGMLSVNLPHQPTVLQSLDMTLTLDKDTYNERLQEARARLHRLYRLANTHGVSTVLVFEGSDAAGKGGAIRRMTAALDARHYKVIPIAAPTDEERAHHYLWRFWRHVARAGRFTVFDRSWYGRVLVERVEGFASTEEWMRAYGEINTFEEQLVDSGVVLGKFWLHITPEEQLRRFEARKEIAWKQWKLTDEDWRNRDKWDDYEIAVNEMVERTSTRKAPWTLVEANCKLHARVKIIETVGDKLEAALCKAGALPPPDEKTKAKGGKRKKG